MSTPTKPRVTHPLHHADAWAFVNRVAYQIISDDDSAADIVEQLRQEAADLAVTRNLGQIRQPKDEWDLLASDLASFLRNRRNADGSITLTPAEVTRLVGILGHAL